MVLPKTPFIGSAGAVDATAGRLAGGSQRADALLPPWKPLSDPLAPLSLGPSRFKLPVCTNKSWFSHKTSAGLPQLLLSSFSRHLNLLGSVSTYAYCDLLLTPLFFRSLYSIRKSNLPIKPPNWHRSIHNAVYRSENTKPDKQTKTVR